MPKASWHQTNFLGGEWSPYAQGRLDDKNYKTALNLCQNAFPLEEGCWTRRVGFRHNGYAHKGGVFKMFNFPFSGDAPYAVELSFDGSASWARFWRGQQLVTDSTLTISNVSVPTGSPATFTTTANLATVSWVDNDYVIFNFPTTADSRNGAKLLNRVFKIDATGAATFTMVDMITGTAVNAADFTYDNTVTNTVSRVKLVSMPYTSAAEIANVQPLMINETDTVNNVIYLVLFHPAHAPKRIKNVSYPALPAFATFSVDSPSATNGPYLGYQEGGTATASAATGAITFDNGGTLVNGGNGWTSADIGRNIRLFSEPADWSSGTSYSQGDVVTTKTFPDSQYWVCVAANSASEPAKFPALWLPSPGAGQYTWGVITAVTDTNTVTLTIHGDDIAYRTNIVFWEMDLFSDWWGWPAGGTVHDGRLWAFTLTSIESRFDASESSDFFSYAPSQPDGTVGDSNAISYILTDSPPTNIAWMLSDSRGLLIGTQRREFIVQATPVDAAITPNNIDVKPVARSGSPLYTQAIIGGSTVIFMDRTQQRLMELIPDTFSGKHTARVLNEKARHLSVGKIQRLAVQDSIVPIIWHHDASGHLYGANYRRVGFYATNPPDMIGFHKHVMGTTWTVKDVCVTSTYVDSEKSDTLYLSTYDGTYYHVEMSTPVFDTSRTAYDGYFLDSSPATIVGRDPALDAGSAGIDLYGLTHLNGKTVTIFIAGLNFGTATVSGGKVNVSYAADSGGLGTAAYLAGLTGATGNGSDTILDLKVSGSRVQVTLPVVIGCSYTSAGQLLRPNDPQSAELKQGPGLADIRRVYQLGMLLRETGSFSVGTGASNLYTAQLTDARDAALGASTMFSGVYWDTLDDSQSFDGQVYWQATGPYPMTVMSVTGFLNTEER